jgi:hypothetical protein
MEREIILLGVKIRALSLFGAFSEEILILINPTSTLTLGAASPLWHFIPVTLQSLPEELSTGKFTFGIFSSKTQQFV